MTTQRQSIAEKHDIDRVEVRIIYKDESYSNLQIKGDSVKRVMVHHIGVDDGYSTKALDLSSYKDSLSLPTTIEAHMADSNAIARSNQGSAQLDIKSRWVVKTVKRLKELQDKNKLLERKYQKALEVCESQVVCDNCDYSNACRITYEKGSCCEVCNKCIEDKIIADKLKASKKEQGNG